MWELVYKESWVLKNWCFWAVVLEKTLQSPLDCKDIQPVHLKGDQPWVFIGRTDEAETPILWPPDVKSWLIWKDPNAGKDWGQEEKGTTEDEMVGWHLWLNGQGIMGLQRVGHNRVTELNTHTHIHIDSHIHSQNSEYWSSLKTIWRHSLIAHLLFWEHLQNNYLNRV